jgi:hypothetical protein
MKCISHKRIYQTHQLAVDALINARTHFDYAPNAGPIAVYQCEDCGYFHLTSKGEINETLAKHLKDGKIQLEKEANRWLHKLKKR